MLGLSLGATMVFNINILKARECGFQRSVGVKVPAVPRARHRLVVVVAVVCVCGLWCVCERRWRGAVWDGNGGVCGLFFCLFCGGALPVASRGARPLRWALLG